MRDFVFRETNTNFFTFAADKRQCGGRSLTSFHGTFTTSGTVDIITITATTTFS